jgi:hypothetical protein
VKQRVARRASLMAVMVTALLATSLLAGAAIVFPLPKPGSAALIAKDVAASDKINAIPSNLDPALANVSVDLMANTKYKASGQGCLTVSPACTFGDTKSKKRVVLFGDSHAWMWLAAVSPVMAKEGYKLELLWKISCPAATVTTLADPSCATWRASAITLINSEKPSLVLVSERTTNVHSSASTFVTAKQWTAGLEVTLKKLQAPATKVVVIGDIPAFANATSPPGCLGIHPTAVQKCSTPVDNPLGQWRDASSSEKAAATKVHAGFIDPTPWICGATSCSEIVGSLAVYFDWSHITATYSAFLADNMGAKIKPFL